SFTLPRSSTMAPNSARAASTNSVSRSGARMRRPRSAVWSKYSYIRRWYRAALTENREQTQKEVRGSDGVILLEQREGDSSRLPDGFDDQRARHRPRGCSRRLG